LTGEPGKDREDRQGHDRNDRTKASGEQWKRLLEEDSWHRTAGTGQLRKESVDRKVGPGKPVQDSRDMTAGEDSR
jgi:hypothetical protein